jgi:hypothetical protein
MGGDDWKLVEQRVHARHDLKQNAEIGNDEAASYLPASIRLSNLHHLYISII